MAGSGYWAWQSGLRQSTATATATARASAIVRARARASAIVSAIVRGIVSYSCNKNNCSWLQLTVDSDSDWGLNSKWNSPTQWRRRRGLKGDDRERALLDQHLGLQLGQWRWRRSKCKRFSAHKSCTCIQKETDRASGSETDKVRKRKR